MGAPSDDQLVVSRLAWEMAQFELHQLRAAFGVLVVQRQADARASKRVRQQYLASLARALWDEPYRRSALSSLEISNTDVDAGLGVGDGQDRPGESA